jgi:multidrug resistance efflux pump
MSGAAAHGIEEPRAPKRIGASTQLPAARVTKQRDFDLSRRLSETKVVIRLDTRALKNGRRWSGLGLIAVALLSSFGLSAANRASDPQDSLAQLVGAEFTGTIAPSQRVAVNGVISGTVRQVLVSVGEAVSAGQPLIAIDDQSVRAQLDAALADHQHATDEALHWRQRITALDHSVEEINATFAKSVGAVAVAQRYAEQVPGRQLRDSPERAQATFDQASSKLERLQRLHAQGLVSDEALEDQTIAARIAKNDLDSANQWVAAAAALQRAQQEQARQQIARTRADFQQQRSDNKARLEQAEARADQALQRVAAARLLLEEAVVKATTDGVVVDIAVEVGERPVAGKPLISIARLDQLVVEVPVASTLVNVLRAGQEATVILPTMPKQLVSGRVGSINPIPAANMTHRIEVEFANSSGLLLSGQPAQVIFR